MQHANILTIYDVVRPRGWLILELMRGSLKSAAEGEPMDLDQLRLVLANCLTGLHFLHGNGVIHGDIKPSNILVAPPNRIKLGDFGLARRASNEEGSLLKGTTKYMAPELLSAQFGAVGPASDLYSLGFTAYELMVGSHFESLLPTLATFGRNQQLAWMMWHSTADVKLPDIAARAGGRAGRPGPRHPAADRQGPVAALPLGPGGPARPASPGQRGRRPGPPPPTWRPKPRLPPPRGGKNASGTFSMLCRRSRSRPLLR